MAFDNVKLPDDIERGAQGGPKFQTSIITLGTGREQRNADWSQQRCEFDVSYGIQSKADFVEVVRFYYARLGKARGFRFKDWTDFAAIDEQIAIGDGTTTQFQLIKNYTSVVTYQRKITRPVNGTLIVKVDDVTTAFTANYNTGVINIAPAPAEDAVITATFEFDVPVRFDNDKLNLNVQTYDAASIGSIDIVELLE